MNDELLTNKTPNRRSLEERLARRPDLVERFHQMADLLDQSRAEGCSADEAERRVIEQIRQLGNELLSQWAQECNEQAQVQTPDHHPQAIS